MSTHNITVAGGKSVRLLTAGKYCDRDIIVTAEGGSEDLNAVLTEQESLIATLQETLRGKAAGEGGGIVTPTQEKTVDITENGIHEVVPDDGYGLSKVTANVNVPIPDGYIVPSGTKEVTENGTHDVTEYASVKVDVPIPDGYIQPSGTKNITSNGTHDAKAYESVSVNVPIPDGYIVPSGNLEITDNGSYDVTEYRSVSVNVEASGTEVETYTGTIIREDGNAYGAVIHYTDDTFTVRSELVPVQSWLAPAEPLTIKVAANTIVFISTDTTADPDGSGFENLFSDTSSQNVGLRLVADNFEIRL